MWNKRTAASAACVLVQILVGVGAHAQAADILTIQAAPLYFEEPARAGGPSQAVVKPVRQAEVVVTPGAAGEYEVRANATPHLWKPVLVYLEQPEAGYNPYSLSLRVPFFERSLEAYAVATNLAAGDRRQIQWLRSRDPNVLAAYGLYEYFAVAQSQFEHYADQSPGDSRDGVKAVYSFAQASRRLIREQYMVETRLSQHARSWLAQAIRNEPQVVDGAVGLANANHLVAEIADIEPALYVRLWENILYERSADPLRYCGLVGALQDDIERQSDSTRRAAIYSYKNLGPIVSTAHADCLGAQWRSGNVDLATFKREVESAITLLERRKDELADGEVEWSTRIANRIDELVAMTSAMAQRQ